MNSFKKKHTYLYFQFYYSFSQNIIGQPCEDSVQFYALSASHKIQQNGISFLKFTNGNNATIAYTHLPEGAKLTIVITDKNGQFLQAKFIAFTENNHGLYIDHLIETQDGGIVGYARFHRLQDGNQDGVVIIKFDKDLNLLWAKLLQRQLGEPELKGDYHLWGITSSPEGNIYCSFYSTQVGYATSIPNVFFLSLDGTGNMLWSRGIDYRNIMEELALNAVTTIGDNVLFMGSCNKDTIIKEKRVSRPACIGFSFDKRNGRFLKSGIGIIDNRIPGKEYIVGLGKLHYSNVIIHPRDKDFYFALSGDVNEVNILHVLVDTAFNFSNTRIIKGPTYSIDTRQDLRLGRSGTISFTSGNMYNVQEECFAIIDSADNILMSKKTGANFFEKATIFPVHISQEEKSITLYVSNLERDSLKIAEIPLYGDSELYSCLGKDTTFFNIDHITLRKEDVQPGTIYMNVVGAMELPLQITNYEMQKQAFCQVKSTCSVISLSGSSTFCTSTTQTFIARKNRECLKAIQWNTENIPATIVAKTDSSISLQFTQSWQGDVIATIGGCGFADTINVVVNTPLRGFNLGDDKTLCPNESITLSVPAGYQKYEWNNGSITAEVTVKQAGVYYATVWDRCGNSFSDTIIIKNPDKIFPSINSESICFKDSLFISKEAGFINYTWQPSVISIGDTLFFLNPDVTTNYTVQVQDGNGCSWKKSFVLTVEKCTKKLWMPTGFTPNKDGLNDELGPKTEGRLQSYSFKVFNRWGEMVFSSTNPNSKWNGKLHGADAPIGVYVWMCNYQFRNEAATMEKGIVTLIR